MNSREKLIQVLKKNTDNNYLEFLLKNFEKHFNDLDYEINYLTNLKKTLYTECYYLIDDTSDFDINTIRIEILNCKQEGIKPEHLPDNISKNDNVIFTFQGFILFIENHKIYFIDIDYFTLDGKNSYFTGGKELLENYKNSILFETYNKIDFKDAIGEYYLLNDGIDWSCFSNKKLMKLFFEKIDEFKTNLINQSNPILKQELSKLIIGENEISWIPSEPFSKLLENHETLIYDKNADYLLKFVKLDSFLSTKRKSLINIHKEVINTKDEDFIFKTIPVLIKQIEYYNQLLLLSINMIVALKNNKMILFFKIYETFDKIGVFDSKWEKSLLNKMDELNISIKDIVNQIQQMEMRLNQKIEDLGFEIQSSIDQMKENVIEEVSSIKGLDNRSAGSILSLINTFQLIGLSNKIK